MIREMTRLTQQYSLTPKKPNRLKTRENPPVKKNKTMHQASRKSRSRIFVDEKENFENDSKLNFEFFVREEEVHTVCRELDFNKQRLFKQKSWLVKRKNPCGGKMDFQQQIWNPVKKLSIGSRD